MSAKVEFFDLRDQQLLEKELESVYRTLSSFQNEFYQRVLGIPGLKSQDLPLIIHSPAGFRDQFSTDINYYFYPWLFSDAFQNIDKEHLDNLCIISQLFAESIIQLDKVIDSQLNAYTEIMQNLVLLSSQYKQALAIRKLAQLFDHSSPFWKRFDEFFNEYLEQVLIEKVDKTLEIPTISQLEKSAIGKVAMSKIITAAMSELTGQKVVLPMLEKSQDLFAVGYQLYDDVKDWQRDYKKGQYSYLLKKAFRQFDIDRDINSGKVPPAENFGRRLHLSNILLDLLELSASYMVRASDAVDSIHCPKWVSWLQMEQQNILRLRSDLIEIRERAIEHAKLKTVPKLCQNSSLSNILNRDYCEQALIQGIAFLQEQQRKDYLEARHLEMIGKKSKHGRKSACNWGVVYQRAVTLHTLVQAKKAKFEIDEEIFDSDLQELIDLRLRNRKGGWSYFPNIAELLPDCDDLAEVLQVLIAVSNPEVSSLCDEPIMLALHEQRVDGGISTWISDPTDIHSVKAKNNMHALWGTNPDTEVMANLLYALWHYDYSRFMGNIRLGASFIVNQQNEKGSWDSTWYDGPYYGTWICTRLLSAIGGYSENINLTRKFLLDTRNTNGGWDTNQDAVLNTAYALITLIRYLKERRPEVVEPAAKRIIELQRKDGSWKGSTFIKMNTACRFLTSMPGFQQQLYKSDTMSTAFAVRSLLAFREL